MDYKDILRDFILEKKMSQENFAKKIGVNQTTISQWLLGNKKPSYDNILSIYKEFGITPNELFGIE